MIGVMATTVALGLFVIPAIYLLWQGWNLRRNSL
jgi:Cu/Ag efflux pump CusA